MRYSLAASALILAATSVYAQGETMTIEPPTSAPAGCDRSYAGSFEITIVPIDGTSSGTVAKRGAMQPNSDVTPLGNVAKRQSTMCMYSGTLVANLNNGVLIDSKGRTGSIVANRQFQFDGPVQVDAIYTGGFAVCSPNQYLALGDSTVFYQCSSGDFFNIYDEAIAEQCQPVYIEVIPCDGSAMGMSGMASGQNTDDQVQNGLNQIADGQIQVPSINQIADGQVQNRPSANQIADGQVRNPGSVNQIADGQLQNSGTGVTDIANEQTQAGVAQQIANEQIQIGDAQQIADEQIQNGDAQQIADELIQAGDAPQIADEQIQNSDMNVNDITDEEIENLGMDVSDIADEEIQAGEAPQTADEQIQNPNMDANQIADEIIQAATETIDPTVDGQIQARQVTDSAAPTIETEAAMFTNAAVPKKAGRALGAAAVAAAGYAAMI